MKKLTQFSVNYPVTILMVVLGVILLGYISYDKLGVDLFPDLNSPRIFVEIKSGERPPEEMEKQFVENIEALAIRQSDVIQVTSVSKVGSAQITVEYAWNKDMDEAFLDLQKALNTLTQNSEIDDLKITQHDPNTSPVMIIGLTHTEINDMNEIRKVAENYIRNELVRLEGVAEVELSGQEESEVIIQTDQYRMDAQNLSMDDISSRIQNFNRNVSGGRISEMGLQYIVKGVSLLDDTEDFENLIVGYKAVQVETEGQNTFERAPIYLKDVATISFGNKDPENIVHINGQRCIGLSIYKETKFNTVKSVEQINESLAQIEKALPGYELTNVTNQGKFISTAIKEVKDTALLGILLAIVVLFLFLRRFGTTLIVSVAIPVSIIATFNLMYFNELTINIMTLGGLALGAGMLVDNAIVVMENIFRNHENGMSVKEAAIVGTSQVGGAITASTLTTIIVFLPIVYLHGASGELFKDQAWTVAFSLVSSLFVAIFLIPMMYHRIYKNKKAPVKHKSVKVGGYGRFLEKVLKIKWVVIFLGVILVAGSFLLVPYIGTEFMPKTETREFTIEMKLQEGTELERTEATVKNIETILSDYLGENLDIIYSQAGPSSGIEGDASSVFEGENTAEIKVILKEETTISSATVIASIDKLMADIPSLEVSFSQEESALNSILGTDEAPVVVEVRGEDLDEIESIVNQVKDKMLGIGGLFNIQTSIEDGAPEVEVTVDRVRAGMYNVDINTVITQIQDQLEGKNAGQLEKDGEMRDITIKVPEKGLNEISDLIITSGTQVFRLSEIADISYGVSPKEIFRRNQNRIGKVTAQMEKGVALDKVANTIRNETANIDMQPDYRILVTGEEEKRQESMTNLGFALLLSIVLVYMVLASQFESLIHPFTILLTIPLAVVGSILIFFIMGITLNIMAIIGIIMLVGIAVNDSIILVDRINQLIRDGVDRTQAILQAGQQRIRPIIMTSLTTILALLPLTIGFGESASLRSPMALAVIGGLVTSTLLTLVVIPCAYDIFDRVRGILVGNRKEIEYK
ncbi:MAG: efflux RND transporter permease subunit [Prolixibacteraceae bacterium]|jgi:hydrophobic/amphiphilic exporter-1 (mainly G- bacteria), HAE1 family|nr:efflux RND transporter permease subunit [Prolixibacteraceae bacterium]MBT7000110.1 efflux RND transporter permease subunit [Prolixibacteraceae bacterium]MBT7395018.1 efflux RND transporter permease subunit [Prolixibacteraceae bacterium]